MLAHKNLTILCMVVIMVSVMALNSLAQSEADILASLFDEECDSPCYLGFEPGVSTLQEIQTELTTQEIAYHFESGLLQWYLEPQLGVTIGGNSGIVMMTVGDNNVLVQTVASIDTTTAAVIAVFGSPEIVSQTATEHSLAYPSLGLNFIVDYLRNPNRVSLIVNSESNNPASWTYNPSGENVDQPCFTYGPPPCVAPTATPTATNTPIPPTATPTPTLPGGEVVYDGCGFTLGEEEEITIVSDVLCANDVYRGNFAAVFGEGEVKSFDPAIASGNRIAYAKPAGQGGAQPGIAYVDTDDGSITSVVTSTGTYADPSWLSSETKIVYAFKPSGSNTKYVVKSINLNGTSESTLTSSSYNSREPHWSGAATKIVYQSDQDGDNDIWVMNSDGTSQTKLTSNSTSDTSPRWSPDGSKIVYVSNEDGNNEIYMMDANGSNKTRLTNNAASDIEPVWSVDAGYVAFASNRISANSSTTGSNYYVYARRASDGYMIQISSVGSTSLNSPDWGMIVVPTATCDPNNCEYAP